MNASAGTDRVCPECGVALRASVALGLCLRCLVHRTLTDRSRLPQEPATLPGIEEVRDQFEELEVREMLGRGGMGVVYAAWQRSLGRLVALKLLTPALFASEDFVDRFQREARLMGQLDHPNVAKVFDFGVTEGGAPYIVMELIRGEPITVFAERQKLGQIERLRLFRAVCSGVHHAHVKGIVHRDLKPSNVLIAEADAAAIPKVIDFGLAKSEALPGAWPTWASTYRVIGTPGYTSPEELWGDRDGVDTRSDIYSLGALLHELLTGAPPESVAADPDIASPDIGDGVASLELRSQGMERASLGSSDGEPEPAQRRVSNPAGLLDDDLTAILRQCLAQDPEARYQTVAALLEDLERFERHEPISARVPTVGYRLGKLVQRRRWAVGGSVLLCLVGLLAGGLLLRSSQLTRRADRLAAERLKQGEALIQFILDELYVQLDGVGRLEVLESTLARVEQFYAGPQATPLSPRSLAHRANARRLLGMVRSSQGRSEEARGFYRESVQIYEQALAAEAHNPAWLEGISEAWNNLAVSFHSGGRMEEAESAYQKALDFNSQAMVVEPHKADWADTRASLSHNLAALYEATGRLELAATHFREAQSIWQELLQAEPTNAGFLDHLSSVHQNLAFLRGRQGRVAEALAENRRTLELRERLVRRDTNNLNWRSALADIQQNLGEFYLNQGNLTEAATWIAQCLPIREFLAQHDPANASWRKRLEQVRRQQQQLEERRAAEPAAK